jgi:hypothetical protein
MAGEKQLPREEGKWIESFGWCDQPFVGVTLHPVERPTAAQIHYVQSLAGYRDQNVLQVRAILKKGGGVAFGLLLPEDVQKLDVRLRELGLEYSVSKELIYRPRA